MNPDRIADTVSPPPGRSIYARLFPGEDLIPGILAVCHKHHVQTAVVLCCIGSLEQAVFSYGVLNRDKANRHQTEGQMVVEGPLSLLGCQGLVCPAEDQNGSLAVHLHGSVFTPQGTTVGQDFAETGNPVFNTVDLVLVETSLAITRRHDPEVNSLVTTVR